MKTFLRFNFALTCAYLFCANCITIASTESNQAQTYSHECTKSLAVSIEDTFSEAELIKRLKKTVECLKILSGNKGRQDDDDDDDFQLPSYVPEIIKVVGSVLAGNASSLVSNSLSLIDTIPGAGGSSGGIGNSITGLIETLATTINQARPIIPTKPPRHRPTRGPTRKPPMRNRTRRTTTRSPMLNQITTLNSITNIPSQNSGVPATITNTKPPGSPIIFVLPNIPNGISAPELAKNPDLLHQVVNQSINALQQPVNNNVNATPQQTNQNLIQQEQSETNASRPINQIPPQQTPSIPQSSPNIEQITNPPSSNNVFSNGNLTFVTSQQPTLTQEQLLTNLLTILTKLSQQPTISPQAAVVAQSPATVPVTPLSVTNETIPSTTEDEYYYYEDDETTPIAGNGTANAIKATTATVDEDDDDGAAAAAAAAAVIIKAGEANSNKTKVTEVSATSDPIQSLAAPTTGRVKITKVTTIKTVDKDKEIDYYDEDYDSATTPKAVPPSPVIKVVQKVTTKLPAIENDEEEAEAQPYSTLRSKAKPPVTVTEPAPPPPPQQIGTTEEIEEDYEENEKITTRRKYIYSKTTAKTISETDEDDTENLFKVKARFK